MDAAAKAAPVAILLVGLMVAAGWFNRRTPAGSAALSQAAESVASVAGKVANTFTAELARLGPKWTNLHPDVQQRAAMVLKDANAHFASHGLAVGVFDGWRPLSEQAQHIANGASQLDHPAHSYHVWGRAVDFVFLKNGRWTWEPDGAGWSPLWDELGEIIERYGFEWGGRWKWRDGPHAQLPDPRAQTLAQNYSEFNEYAITWRA